MTKRLISLFLTAAVFFCSGCAGGQGQKIVGNDTAITSRLENMVELQKNIFVGEILSVATEDAIITKYNIDLTKYTVYTVNITRSIDGYTPTGQAKLYCLGTTDEFVSRINMKKGETYIIDAQPWIYGDELIYLLPIYTEAYPRVDAAGMVTIAQNENEALSGGTLEEYIGQYDEAKETVLSRLPDFATPKNLLLRVGAYIEEINEKNTAKDAYSADKGYKWQQSEELKQKTTQNSAALFARYNELVNAKSVTQEQVSDFIQSVLSGRF